MKFGNRTYVIKNQHITYLQLAALHYGGITPDSAISSVLIMVMVMEVT